MVSICRRYFFIILGILTGCILLAGGALWAVIDNNPVMASRWLSTFLNQEAHIDAIDLRWEGFRPQLKLTNIRITDLKTRRQLLAFKEISFAAGSAAKDKSQHVIITGGQLIIEQKPEGCFRILGLQNLNTPCSHHSYPPWWLSKFDQLALVDIIILWNALGLEGKPMGLKIESLRLVNNEDIYRIEGSAILSKGLGKRIKIKAKFDGKEIQDPKSGLLYVKGEGLQLEPWQAYSFFNGLHFTRGTGDLELTLRWDKAALRQSLVKFDWKELGISGNSQAVGIANKISFQQLTGVAHYQQLTKGWSITVPRLSVIRGNQAWPPTSLQIKVEKDPILKLQGQFKFLRLQDIIPIYQLGAQTDSRLSLLLAKIQPAGDLRDIKIILPFGETQAKDWEIFATAENFGTQPWQHWLGCQGLSFKLQLAGGSGQLHMDSHNARLFSNYLEQPVALNTFQGKVIWRLKNGGWQILGDNIQLQNQDLALAGSLQLNKGSGENTPYLDLSLILQEMNLTTLSKYLPASIMKPHLVQWLDQAFLSGQIKTGSLLFQGPVDYFSSDRTQGQFTADLDLSGVTLHYSDQWPVFKQIDGHFHSDGQKIIVNVARGKLFNANIMGITAEITDLSGNVVPLKAVGQALGDSRDVRDFIQQSPLKEEYGGFIERVEVHGNTHINLSLGLAIRGDARHPKVDGELVFTDAYLRQLENLRLEFTAIRGGLHFTEKKLVSKNLTGQLLGRPVKADLSSLPGKSGSDGRVELSLSGRMEAQALAKKWFSSWSPWLQGSANFTTKMILQNGKKFAVTMAQVSSDLKGIKVTLPPPLEKPADQVQKLFLEIYEPIEDKRRFEIAYGEKLQGIFEAEDGELLDPIRGEIRVGGDPPLLPDQGVQLVGVLPNLLVDAWQQVLIKVAQAGSMGNKLKAIILQADQAELFGWHFKKIIIKANRSLAHHWQAQVTAPNLRGVITIPDTGSNQPLAINLDYLRLRPKSSSNERLGTDSNLQPALNQDSDPNQWPSIDLVCRQCWYDDYNLGLVQAHTSTYEGGLYLRQLEIISAAAQIKASGDWILNGRTQRSSLEFKVYSPELGQLLTSFGYRANIIGGETEIDVAADWPGSPTSLTSELSSERLNGTVQLKVGKGRLLSVESGPGQSPNILNVSAFHRRLPLDFSDVFGEGLPFDQIEGGLSFNQGDLYFNKFIIEGPMAQVRANGKIGFGSQNYNSKQTIRVAPSLPLVGSMVGGPIGLGVGTILMLTDKLIDKIFGAQFGQLMAYYYQVSGSLPKPAKQ